MLLEFDRDVEVLPDARQALARVRSGPTPDAILCDLMMAEMTGMQFHEELSRQALERVRRTTPWLLKPFKLQQLEEVLSSSKRCSPRSSSSPAVQAADQRPEAGGPHARGHQHAGPRRRRVGARGVRLRLRELCLPVQVARHGLLQLRVTQQRPGTPSVRIQGA
jgi:hypothetical protein